VKSLERRRVKSLVVCVPMVFCRFSPADAPVGLGEIVYVSRFGISFTSPEAIASGAMLQVFPQLAREVIESPLPPSPWTGMVVWARPLPNGETELGMRFMMSHGVNDIPEGAIHSQMSV
jgi:hypothetical protein